MHVQAPRLALAALFAAALCGALTLGCQGDEPTDAPTTDAVDVSDAADVGTEDADEDSAPGDVASDTSPWVWPESVSVRVTLDGEPAANTVVMQAGSAAHHRTDDAGEASFAIDESVVGTLTIVASHPEARIGHATLDASTTGVVLIELTRYDPSDNPEYAWQDPGTPRMSPTTAQCGHCHQTLNADWYESPHRRTAANPVVQDVYRGVALALDDQERCEEAGGAWRLSRGLGGFDDREMCNLGAGVIPDLNECEDPTCSTATDFGLCADCHAPATTTEARPTLGGHDLRDADGLAYRFGVFCDVCHRVDRVAPDDPAAGVAGRLALTRPSEAQTGPLGPWRPLTFGPSHDSPNVRMGSVQRDHFRDGTLCAGCHQLDQPVLVPGQEIDRERWPDGVLPIHSTWDEWESGPLAGVAPCNACHMPPAPSVLNGGDLQNFPLSEVGVQGGWYRPPGSVRHHSWVGPRTPESGMLGLAAALLVEKEVVDGELVARVTTRNVGPAHAIPTGEPMRSLLLVVDAYCGEAPLEATGGDVVPGWGGASEARPFDEPLRWTDVAPGDRIRVVETDGTYHDYQGFGPFGDGRFDAAEKGLPVERFVAEAEVVSVGDDGIVLDRTLPEGTRAYRVRAAQADAALAGRPGFAFARVLVDAAGDPMVPHHRAVDVASDNRLLPGQEWVSTHRFRADCAEPEVRARLLHRPYPYALATERGWELGDQVMTEVRR